MRSRSQCWTAGLQWSSYQGVRIDLIPEQGPTTERGQGWQRVRVCGREPEVVRQRIWEWATSLTRRGCLRLEGSGEDQRTVRGWRGYLLYRCSQGSSVSKGSYLLQKGIQAAFGRDLQCLHSCSSVWRRPCFVRMCSQTSMPVRVKIIGLRILSQLILFLLYFFFLSSFLWNIPLSTPQMKQKYKFIKRRVVLRT